MGEIFFGSKVIKLYSDQYLIIFNVIMKWPNSGQMTFIHGLSSIVVDYFIYDIPLYNQIIKFDILNDHEPNLDHRPLTVALNFFIHSSPIDKK